MSLYGIIFGRDVLASVQYIFEQLTKQGLNFQDAKILIKPNLVAPLVYTTGATTDLALIEAIIKQLKELGASRIFLAESSWVGASTQEAFKVTGYLALAEKEQVTLIDIKKEPWKSKPLKGIINKSIAIPRAVEEADYIINVPVFKCHSQTVLSMGMKNLKGLIPDFEKKDFI
ncbi:MAG: DUF362 domain-containing protein [Firmicutes bacterium]|nr:DUF362 domain-containing protein [Bacillota bacterium]